jgi:hypothetical protein
MEPQSSLSKSAFWFLFVAVALGLLALAIVLVRGLYDFFFDHPLLFRASFIGLNVLFVLSALVSAVLGLLAPDDRRGNRAALAAFVLVLAGEAALWALFATSQYPE